MEKKEIPDSKETLKTDLGITAVLVTILLIVVILFHVYALAAWMIIATLIIFLMVRYRKDIEKEWRDY